jgi:cold shock CspA family protein
MSQQSISDSGVIKWFAEARGYGFLITPAHRGDLFFHIRDYTGPALPKAGDKVSFVLGTGRDGRSAAKNVRFLSEGERPDHRPYHGKPTQKTTHGGVGGATVGFVIGSVLGPVGAIVGAVLGASITNTVQITETCLRCGGVGNVTAITPQHIGFQCEKCRAFWKKRNRDNLTPEQVSQPSNERPRSDA